MRRAAIAFLLVAISSYALLTFASDKKQLSEAVAAVEANMKTDAGKKFDAQIGKDFQDHYVNSVRGCKPSGTPTTFDLFLRLDAAGKVNNALIYPETPFNNCVQSAFSSAKFSAPPHPDYWINIHVDFKK